MDNLLTKCAKRPDLSTSQGFFICGSDLSTKKVHNSTSFIHFINIDFSLKSHKFLKFKAFY